MRPIQSSSSAVTAAGTTILRVLRMLGVGIGNGFAVLLLAPRFVYQGLLHKGIQSFIIDLHDIHAGDIVLLVKVMVVVVPLMMVMLLLRGQRMVSWGSGGSASILTMSCSTVALVTPETGRESSRRSKMGERWRDRGMEGRSGSASSSSAVERGGGARSGCGGGDCRLESVRKGPNGFGWRSGRSGRRRGDRGC